MTPCGSFTSRSVSRGSGMAEQGNTPGGRRGYAGTWPPRAAAPVGGFVPVHSLAAFHRNPAPMGACGSGCRPSAAVGAGRVRHGIAFYFAADHEPVRGGRHSRPECCARRRSCCAGRKCLPLAVMIAALAAGFATATWKTVRIAHGVLPRPMYSVTLSGFVETREIRERTDRFVLRVVTMESARGPTKLRTRAAFGQEGHRARGRQLRRTESTAVAAAGAAAAGRLRFRPRHVIPTASARPGSRWARSEPQSRRPPAGGRCAMRRHAGHARRDRRAHPHRAQGRPRAIATALFTGSATRSPRR